MAKSILLAEDGKAARQSLSFVLANRGFHVIEAVTGTEALEKARSMRPDVIILDSEMPEMSGYEVYQKLRETPDCKSIPVFVLVADTDSFEIPTRSVPPANFLISKPFSAHDLVQKIEKALA